MNKILTLFLLLPFLFSCSGSLDMSLPVLYKDDVNQGSILEIDKINKLEVGMSKPQVRDIIGSPSIIDPFHNNQWEYINHSTLHEKDNIHYHLTLTFKDDILVNILKKNINQLELKKPKVKDKVKIKKETSWYEF